MKRPKWLGDSRATKADKQKKAGQQRGLCIETTAVTTDDTHYEPTAPASTRTVPTTASADRVATFWRRLRPVEWKAWARLQEMP
jgi:hypothetical protein